MNQDLRAILAEISSPESGHQGETRYHVRKVSGTPHYVGKDADGLPCVLLDSTDHATRPPIRLATLDVQFSLLCRISEHESRESTRMLTVITCRSRDLALIDYFAHVVQTVIDIVGPQPRGADIAEVVRRLTELFQSLSRTTDRSVIGLFGELYAIYLSRSPQATLDAWRSTIDDRFDFSVEDVRLEVKSSSDRIRAHHFSRDQCMPPDGTVGILVSLFVERSGGGLSLAELIKRVEGRIAGNSRLMLKLRATVAETLGDTTAGAMSMRFDEQLARNSVRLFDLACIPAIRGDIPVEISQVRFRADMSGLTPVRASELIARSVHARNLLPTDG